MGQMFLTEEHPILKEEFKDYNQKVTNKYISLEKYFEQIDENINDYIIIGHGPIYGPDDPRDGYIMSNTKTNEMISVSDKDIPIITKVDSCLFADTMGYLKTPLKIQEGIYVDINEVERIRDEFFPDYPTRFNHEFINDWEPGRTFLYVKP